MRLRSGWQNVTESAPPVGQLVLTFNCHGYALRKKVLFNEGEEDQEVGWKDEQDVRHDGYPPDVFCLIPEHGPYR